MKVYEVDNTPKLYSLPTSRLILAAIVTVLSGGFHFGFQISIVNPMASVIQDFLFEGLVKHYNIELEGQTKAIIWSLVASEILIGALFGAAYVTRIIDKHGPLKALYNSSLIQLLSVLLLSISGFAFSPVLFVVSRLFSGISIGMSATAQGVFLADISPVEHKGKIGSLGGFSTNIGFIMAATLGLPYILGKECCWPYIFLLESFPSMLFLVSSCVWIRESPYYHVKRGEFEEAKRSIQYYGRTAELVEEEMSRIALELKTTKTEGMSFWELTEDKASRRALMISITLNVAVAFSGITAVSFFGTYLLQTLGFSEPLAATANLCCSFSGTAGALLATVATDKIGIRILVQCGLIFLIVLNSLMMLFVFIYSVTLEPLIGWVFFSLFVLFLFSFSAGIGPAAWSIGAELAPAHSRSKIQTAAMSTQYLACFISPIIYYPLSSTIGPISFVVFIIPLLLTAVYLHYNLPYEKTTEDGIQEKAKTVIDANGNDIA